MKENSYEYWHLAIRKYRENIEGNTEPFWVLPNPWGYWAADPFLLFDDGKYYVFAELCDKNAGRGKLGVIVIDENGKVLKNWKVIMDNKHHLSFPNVWKSNGEYYMMPESNKVDKLSVFKAVEFPYKWEEQTVLIDGEKYCDSVFVDESTILSYDEFTGKKYLVLLKKDSTGWKRASVVSDDDRKLRPAGRVISTDNSTVVVPLQNCGEYYGRYVLISSLKINEEAQITGSIVLYELSPEKITLSNSKLMVKGMHTYNQDGNLEIVDLKSFEFSHMIYFRKQRQEFKRFIMRAGSKIKRTFIKKQG